MTWGPHIPLTLAPILDGDGHGGRAVKSAGDRIELDIAAANTLLESLDLPPIEPDSDGVITLDSAGLWRYRPVGSPNRWTHVQAYERIIGTTEASAS